jgi:hypothetical protein
VWQWRRVRQFQVASAVAVGAGRPVASPRGALTGPRPGL